jgi:LPXTG-site transpeptidase (sortase) family protein
MGVTGQAQARPGVQVMPRERVKPWPVILGIVFVFLGTFGVAPELAVFLFPPQEIQPPADLEGGFAPLLAPMDVPAAAGGDASPSSALHWSLSSPGGQAQVAPSGMGAESSGGSDTSDASDAPASAAGYIPERLIIPSIGVDAPVEMVSHVEVEIEGEVYQQWQAPDSDAVGWHESSARIGVPGNTVFNGHHNIYGEVFRDLSQLEAGDLVFVSYGTGTRAYEVAAKMILKERSETLERRLENARWIQPTQDERLTLITCWPYSSNTHRVVVVATPLDPETYNRIGDPQVD